MREILFRGKLATGKWAYGNLDVKKNGVCIITPDDTPLGSYGQVDPETVGQYAVAHGFWEDATDERMIALIHSEWSEALQADRSGCAPLEVCTELIDGVIRLLDYCAAKEMPVAVNEYRFRPEFFPMLCELHALTYHLLHLDCNAPMNPHGSVRTLPLVRIPSLVFAFCRSYDVDPYDLMRRKHEYNLTRPKRHGKRY